MVILGKTVLDGTGLLRTEALLRRSRLVLALAAALVNKGTVLPRRRHFAGLSPEMLR